MQVIKRSFIRRGAVALVATLTCGSTYAQTPDVPNASIARSASGTLVYRKMTTGVVTGSEHWSMVAHPDGSRTLHTSNRMDATGLHRNVVLNVGRNFRPLSLYAFFWFKGRWIGTSLATVDGERLRIVANTPDGTLTQERAIPDRFAFIPHPPASNAWQVGQYDRARGGTQMIAMYDLQTHLPGPGNMFGSMRDQEVELLGIKDIETPAGRFRVDHYRSGAAEFYVHGPDAIIVRMVWEDADEEYVLTSLTTAR